MARERTRQALYDNGRPSLTITIPDVSPRTVGMLIALYERAVGLYATLVNVNAYHQPGVEAGKKAAAAVLDLQRTLLTVLRQRGEDGATCEELADMAGEGERVHERPKRARIETDFTSEVARIHAGEAGARDALEDALHGVPTLEDLQLAQQRGIAAPPVGRGDVQDHAAAECSARVLAAREAARDETISGKQDEGVAVDVQASEIRRSWSEVFDPDRRESCATLGRSGE